MVVIGFSLVSLLFVAALAARHGSLRMMLGGAALVGVASLSIAADRMQRVAAQYAIASNAHSRRVDAESSQPRALDQREVEQRLSVQHVHDRTVDFFIAQPSFGIGRGLVATSEPWFGNQNDEIVDRGVNTPDFLTLERFASPHGDDRLGFRPDRLGKRRLGRPTQTQLVSLLIFEEPRVYTVPMLPRMDDNKGTTTRKLDLFEQQALAKLELGEEIVIREAPGLLRAMGALRAKKQCLACHRNEQGELLGAFAYAWQAPAKEKASDVVAVP